MLEACDVGHVVADEPGDSSAMSDTGCWSGSSRRLAFKQKPAAPFLQGHVSVSAQPPDAVSARGCLLSSGLAGPKVALQETRTKALVFEKLLTYALYMLGFLLLLKLTVIIVISIVYCISGYVLR